MYFLVNRRRRRRRRRLPKDDVENNIHFSLLLFCVVRVTSKKEFDYNCLFIRNKREDMKKKITKSKSALNVNVYVKKKRKNRSLWFGKRRKLKIFDYANS